MKHNKSFVLAILIGMVLLAVAVSIAQTTVQQADQKKQTESCCAMDSCCCHGDSCAMKSGAKTEGAAGASCCGDSCDMKTKHDAKNHATAGCSCCAAHNTTATGSTQSASNQPTKHECCSADMANKMTANHDMKNMKNHDMKNMNSHDMKDGCCCCGDSCDMDMKKTAK